MSTMLPTFNDLAKLPQPIYSNHVLRQLLQMLRLCTRPMYPAILEQVDLLAYEAALPPDNTLPAVPGPTLTQLLNAAYRYLLPPQAVLFALKMGEQQARDLWTAVEIQRLAAAVQALPAEEQVAAVFAQSQARFPVVPPDTFSLLDDDRNHYLLCEPCPCCAGIRGQAHPICISIVRYYEVLLQQVFDRAIVVREVECAAAGQGRCVFAVRRERASAEVH